MFRQTSRMLMQPSARMMMRPTRKMMGMPSEKAAGTTKVRFQRLKDIPVEVYPLGIVVGFMVSIATFSLGKQLFFGKNIRRHRQNREEVWE